MYAWNLSRCLLLGIVSIQLALIGCSRGGYIKVQNQSDTMIENVSWGNVVELGTIHAGQEAAKETDHYDSFHLYFSKAGKKYMSKQTITVDAKTSATYIHKGSNDADMVNE